MSYHIIVDQEAWEKFATYVDLCPDEVGAFGYCEPQEDFLWVSDIFLVPQEVSGTEVDYMKDGLVYAVEKAATDGKVDQLRFSIHSHVNMGCKPSSTDFDMIGKIRDHAKSLPWFVSAIVNKKGEAYARVDVFEAGVPGLPGISHVGTDALIYPEGAAHLREQATADLKQFVTKKVYQSQHWNKQAKGSGKGKPKGKPKGKGNGKAPGLPTHQGENEFVRQVELELYRDAKKNNWEMIEDTDGKVHVFSDDNTHKGVLSDTEIIGWIDQDQYLDWSQAWKGDE